MRRSSFWMSPNQTYARKGITHKNESLTDPQHPEQYKKMPILEDVYNVLLESEDTNVWLIS